MVFYLGESSSGNDGDFAAWVYDRQENRRVTTADALALAGVEEDELLDGLERLQTDDPEDPRVVLDRSVLGFRIKEDGGVVFYLSVTVDGTDALDGWYRLYQWEDGAYDRYSDFVFSPRSIRPLVPAEETMEMSPPLWNQWHDQGGEPEGGFLRSQVPEAVREQARSFVEEYPVPEGARAVLDEDGGMWLHTAYDDLSGLAFTPGWSGGADAVECYALSVQVIQEQDGGGELDYIPTHLVFLRGGEDYTYVGSISSGYDQSEPGRLAAAAPYNFKVMYLLLEQGILDGIPDMETLLEGRPAPQGAKSALLAWFYSQGIADRDARVYFAEAAPLSPEVGDRRIDGMEYAGLAATYETLGVAYRVSSSGYEIRNGAEEWQTFSPYYVVLGLEQDGFFTEVRGEGNVERGAERVILEATYGLIDLEVSLWRDGWPWPAGPGSQVQFFREVPEVTVMEGWEPIYNEGDSWQQYGWPGFTALCYCTAEGTYAVNSVDTTLADLSTWRGIRVGSTRAELEEAYPGLAEDTDEDGKPCLYWGTGEIFGPFLRFYMEGGQVGRIVAGNAFD